MIVIGLGVLVRIYIAYIPVFGNYCVDISGAGFLIGISFRNTCKIAYYRYFPAYIG